MKSKKAVMDQLLGLGIGITVIGFVVVIGMVVLGNFGTSQANCESSIGGDTAVSYNPGTGYCVNSSGATGSHGAISAQASYYGATKLGSSTGGLLTWLPIIIPAIIGIAIIGMFLGMRGKKSY